MSKTCRSYIFPGIKVVKNYSSGIIFLISFCHTHAHVYICYPCRCMNIYLKLQAAATTCYVATNPSLTNVSGKYFVDCNEASPSKLACNPDEAARLWSFSEIMVSTEPKTVVAHFHGLDQLMMKHIYSIKKSSKKI